MSRLRTIACNALWFMTCLPGYFRFLFATSCVRRCQTAKLLRLLRRNRRTEYGRMHHFKRIRTWRGLDTLPLTDYEHYRPAVERILDGCQQVLTADPVRILQPTSGTSSAPKLIPHTGACAKEFRAALDAWIVDLFRQRPGLVLGTQYWSISPSTEPQVHRNSEVPVGFLDDAEYFGKQRRRIVDEVMAVPSIVRHIDDVETGQYVTALFLLRAKDLRLLSVWHPSFLTILLDAIRAAWPRLLNDLANGGIGVAAGIPEEIRDALDQDLAPMPERARALTALNPQAIDLLSRVWPDLQVISCWRDGAVHGEIAMLEKLFPGVLIQGKGLLATEGVISIPLGAAQRHVCAVTSHVLEFQDDGGAVHPIWNVERGKQYSIVVTTAGGLYRYQLKDRVQVTGFRGQAPCIRFLGRAGVVSDCVGEKLHIDHVAGIVRDLSEECFQNPLFSMLVPSMEGGHRRYNLLVEARDGAPPAARAAARLEQALCSNYHYAHARRTGQLQHAVVTLVDPGARVRYRRFMTERGAAAGTVKFPALCTIAGIERELIDARSN